MQKTTTTVEVEAKVAAVEAVQQYNKNPQAVSVSCQIAHVAKMAPLLILAKLADYGHWPKNIVLQFLFVCVCLVWRLCIFLSRFGWLSIGTPFFI